jgi:hypothetical protein
MPELLGRLQSALADRYRLDREVGAGGMATVIWPGPRSGARERWR